MSIAYVENEKTGRVTTYDTYEDMIAEKASGFVVVSVIQKTSKKGRVNTYTRVQGVYPDREKARSAAQYRRKWWKEQLKWHSDIALLGVHIEPIWKKL